MAADAIDMNDLKKRMEGAISSLKHELSGLRTGRASVNLLDPIMVDADEPGGYNIGAGAPDGFGADLGQVHGRCGGEGDPRIQSGTKPGN